MLMLGIFKKNINWLYYTITVGRIVSLIMTLKLNQVCLQGNLLNRNAGRAPSLIMAHIFFCHLWDAA